MRDAAEVNDKVAVLLKEKLKLDNISSYILGKELAEGNLDLLDICNFIFDALDKRVVKEQESIEPTFEYLKQLSDSVSNGSIFATDVVTSAFEQHKAYINTAMIDAAKKGKYSVNSQSLFSVGFDKLPDCVNLFPLVNELRERLLVYYKGKGFTVVDIGNFITVSWGEQ